MTCVVESKFRDKNSHTLLETSNTSNAAKVWTLSAQDVNDDDVVSIRKLNEKQSTFIIYSSTYSIGVNYVLIVFIRT